jgi:hypothetical protein
MTEQAAVPVDSAPAASKEINEARPFHEEVATLAYSLWQARGCPEGTPDDDWFKAEEVLQANGGRR